MSAIPPLLPAYSSEQLHGCERFGRPWPEAIEAEPGLLAGVYIHKHVVVLLLGWLTLPVEIRRIVRRQLDARAPGENRILFRAAAAQHQVLHAVDLEHLGGVDVAVEHDH